MWLDDVTYAERALSGIDWLKVDEPRIRELASDLPHNLEDCARGSTERAMWRLREFHIEWTARMPAASRAPTPEYVDDHDEVRAIAKLREAERIARASAEHDATLMSRLPPAKRLALWLARRRYSWRVALVALHAAGALHSPRQLAPHYETWGSAIEGRSSGRLHLEVALPKAAYWPQMRHGLWMRCRYWPESLLPGPFRRVVENLRSIRREKERRSAPR